MMTTISSAALTAAPRLALTQAQSALSSAQVELSSGKLADIGLGLGGGTGQYVSLAVQQSRLQAIKDSNATATTKLTATTSALDALRTTATSFLSSLTSADSTATASSAVSSTLVTSASNNLEDLTSTLNTSVGDDYIFGGINTASAPMTAYTSGSASKAAVDSSFSSTFATTQDSTSVSSISGTDMQSYLDGAFADLFGASGYAATWSSASKTATSAQISTSETVDTSVSANADAFKDLAQAYTMVKEFGSSNFGSAAGQAVVTTATKLVSSALAGITTTEATIGASQTAVTNANDRMTSQISYLSTQSDDMVDVDASTLSTKISGLQTQIQASYEITAQLQQLSLVSYLK